MEFPATLAADHADASPLVKQPGSDGFSLSSALLFQGSFLTEILPCQKMAGLGAEHAGNHGHYVKSMTDFSDTFPLFPLPNNVESVL